MIKLFKMSLESLSDTNRNVIVIKGNPKYLNNSKLKKLGEAFYREVKVILEKRGFKVSFDAGEPYTVPDQTAYAWVGHSRGIDRLRYAEGPKTLALVTKDNYIEMLKNAITKKDIEKARDLSGFDPKHYQLSSRDIAELNRL